MKKLYALLFSFLIGSAMAFVANDNALIPYKFYTPLSQKTCDIVKKMNLSRMKWKELHEEKYIIEENLIDELSEQTFIEFGNLASSYIKYKAAHEKEMMLKKLRYPANSLAPSYFSVVQELQEAEATLSTLYYRLHKEIAKRVKNEEKRCAIIEKLILTKP